MKKLGIPSAVLLLVFAITGCPAQKEPQQPQQQEQGFAPAPLITPDQIRHLQEAAALDPNNPAGWVALGNALYDMNRCGARQGPHQIAGCTEAAKAYQKALERDPKNVNVRVDRGTSLWAAGDFEKALAEHRKAQKQDPRHLHAIMNAGITLNTMDRPAEAIKEFEKALKLYPQDPSAHINAGFTLNALGRPAEAIREFEEYLRRAPNAPNASGVRAMIDDLKAGGARR